MKVPFTGIITLLLIVNTAFSLKCQKCSTTVTAINGMISEDSAEIEDCVEETCSEGQDLCITGYSRILIETKIEVETGSTMDVEMDMNMHSFKECGSSSDGTGQARCDAIAASISQSEYLDSGAKIDVKECKIETCSDSDNCNDQDPGDFNPAGPLERIECYSCEKTTVYGADAEDQKNTECTSENKVTCPLGVATCIAGNAEGDVLGAAYIIDYRKGCGSTMEASCEMMEMYLEMLNGKYESCSVHTCEGNLCNDQTAEETSKLTGTSGSQRMISGGGLVVELVLIVLAFQQVNLIG